MPAALDLAPDTDKVALASDPETPPEVLVALWTASRRGKGRMPLVRRAIVRNPNVPSSFLWEMRGSPFLYPDLAYNPALPLWILANDSHGIDTLLEVLRHEIFDEFARLGWWFPLGALNANEPPDWWPPIFRALWSAFEVTEKPLTADRYFHRFGREVLPSLPMSTEDETMVDIKGMLWAIVAELSHPHAVETLAIFAEQFATLRRPILRSAPRIEPPYRPLLVRAYYGEPLPALALPRDR